MIARLIPLLALAASTAAAPITFTEHIAPVVFQNCSSCHRPGEGAPFSLLTYRDVAKRAKLIARVTAEKVMPPWHADESDFAFAGDRRLTAAQIKLFQRWLNAGTPEGPTKKLPERPNFPNGWQLGQPDLIVKMEKPFRVPADGRDIYRSFALPLNLKEDRWIKAIEFRPGAPSVVHHSLFFYDTTGYGRRMQRQGNGFARMRRGQRGVGPLGGWAVGGQPRFLPKDLAYFLPKGADLILSTHFHPSGKAEEEVSTVGIYFAKEPPRHTFTGVQLPPAFGALSGVDIPPGEKNYTITDSFVLPVDVEAFGISGHMHYLGKQLHFTATLPNGQKRKLIGIKNWDFSWQEQYLFKQFVTLPKGTRLDVKLTWDNSATNPNNPTIPPQRVRWGPQSTDEMGSLTLLAKLASNADRRTLESAQRTHAGTVIRRTALERVTGRGDPEVIMRRFLRENDKNGNGKIERAEAPRWLLRSFANVDANKDGTLDRDELIEGRRRLLSGRRN